LLILQIEVFKNLYTGINIFLPVGSMMEVQEKSNTKASQLTGIRASRAQEYSKAFWHHLSAKSGNSCLSKLK
jgi:hypothetical protein